MVQPWDRVQARGGDPFAQLDLALKRHATAVPDDEYVELGGPPPLDLTPETVMEPDITLEFLTIQLPFARRRAEERGEALRFDQLICQACAGSTFMRVRAASYWQMACETCGTLLPRQEVTKALGQVAEFAAVAVPRTHVEREERNWVKVFRFDDLTDLETMAALSSSDEHAQTRLKATVRRLVKSSTVRHLAAPSAKWEFQLDKMREQFPNFRRAIDEVIAPSFAVASAGGRIRPSPMLMVGPPGCGKTFFSSSLAEMLRTPTFGIDMSAASTGSSLDGLAVYWSNAAPGLVFTTLAWGRPGSPATANPIGVLDELDKVCSGQRYDPLAPLHALLEVESAKRFEDQSLPGIAIDASHVRWLCCANALEPIPKPLLSRLHVVQVEPPTLSESYKLFEQVFSNVVGEALLRDFEEGIARSILNHALGKWSVREFKTRAGMAIGRALLNGRRCVQTQDFETSYAADVRRIGF